MKQRSYQRITEEENPAAAFLDALPTNEILNLMNNEDQKVALAVRKAIPQIARAVDMATEALAGGGRLVYVGAGTSGRLGVLDAAECLPTFGSKDVVAIMPGGRKAMFQAVEGAEDNCDQAREDLERVGLNSDDVLVGLSASGHTPYTLEAVRYARRLRADTIGITSNPAAPLRRLADVPIVVAVGPEVIAGSTRLKAGTAEKLVLNMLSTATMVRLGRVLAGWMTHVQLKNRKLWERGRSILVKATGTNHRKAGLVLTTTGGNLPVALLMLWNNISEKEALRLLSEQPNPARVLREAWERHLRAGRFPAPGHSATQRKSATRRQP
jgi:N-acetylmuramic acid 6-phosphate etherase